MRLYALVLDRGQFRNAREAELAMLGAHHHIRQITSPPEDDAEGCTSTRDSRQHKRLVTHSTEGCQVESLWGLSRVRELTEFQVRIAAAAVLIDGIRHAEIFGSAPSKPDAVVTRDAAAARHAWAGGNRRFLGTRQILVADDTVDESLEGAAVDMGYVSGGQNHGFDGAVGWIVGRRRNGSGDQDTPTEK